jgi:hypothetical protein
MKQARYTIDGSDALELLIRDTCQDISREIRSFIPARNLQALVLAGGYGRGEGGVLKTESGDAPYNDLEFFLFLSGSSRLHEQQYGAAIQDIEQRMTEKIGIDVEFKITSLESTASRQTTMFTYDLVHGHKVFAGPDDALRTCSHHTDATRIPPHEATRLLMNRCSGLLFAKQRLEEISFSATDADFVARNIAKAQLALGDALLTINGRYHWSCLERHERLRQIPNAPIPLDELLSFHQSGVNFKLHPHVSTATRDQLSELYLQVTSQAWSVWRQVEEFRLKRTMRTPLDYAATHNKCPETSPLKNALLRLRTFGISGWRSEQRFRYPREALLNSLALLLWAPQAVDFSWLTSQFASPICNWQDAFSAYQKLWSRYN